MNKGLLFALVLCAVGLIVLLVGGAGIPDGIGGRMPAEGGAKLIGGAALVVGLGLLGYQLAKRRNGAPP